jgi:hypothetical protein
MGVASFNRKERRDHKDQPAFHYVSQGEGTPEPRTETGPFFVKNRPMIKRKSAKNRFYRLENTVNNSAFSRFIEVNSNFAASVSR